MKILKVIGNSSKLELRLEHPIHGEYKIGLAGFYSDNFVQNFNIDAPYYIGMTFTLSDKSIIHDYYPFYSGFYSLDDIKEIFINHLKHFKTKSKEINFDQNDFELKTVKNRITLKSPVKMIFTAIVIDLLGLADIVLIERNTLYKGVKQPTLRPFDVIEVHCNLIEPSIENHPEHDHLHKESETLYQFFPNASYGSKISEKPAEMTYVPLKTNLIQNIVITIKDGKGKILNNKANNIIYLRLINDSTELYPPNFFD